jgi:hypothetical protein
MQQLVQFWTLHVPGYLGFCGAHGIGAEVEVIDADRIDEP